MVKFKSLTSPSVILLVLGSHVHAWLATLYQNIYISADRFLERTYAITSTAVVTGPVTPISTATTNGGAFDSGQQLTIIELYISGSNLLVSTPTRDSGVFGSSTPVTTSTISVRSVYFAEATITQPPTCVNTKFSYTTQLSIRPPSIMFVPPNSVPVTSSTSYMTTSFYTNAVGQTTASTSWSEADFFVAGGNTIPPLSGDMTVLLANCRDPRGCFFGQGEGCTATGVTAGVTGTGGASPTESKKSQAGLRIIVPKGDRLWISVFVSMIAVLLIL